MSSGDDLSMKLVVSLQQSAAMIQVNFLQAEEIGWVAPREVGVVAQIHQTLHSIAMQLLVALQPASL
jgi:hypothetical protein